MATGNIALNFFTLLHSLKNQSQSKTQFLDLLLGTTKHSYSNCSDTWQYSFIALLLLLLISFMVLYSANLHSRADSLHSNVILKACLQLWHGWCHKKLLPSWHILCTPHNHAPCYFMQSHKRKVHAYLTGTCHLHFWQNDWDLLHATVVTWGWNKY